MNGPLVDIHCHVFNADDLPVRGFVEHLHLDTPYLGRMLSSLVDKLTQGAAPGFREDMGRIEALIAADAAGPEAQSAESRVIRAGLDQVGDPIAQAERDVARLLAEDPVFVRRLAAGLDAEMRSTAAVASDAVTAESLAETLGSVRRAAGWARLFGFSRLDLARRMTANFGGEIDLFCPLLVDLGDGLGDRPKTSMREQVQLLEGISRLSMLGRLPGAGEARLHPFVGFDPRRQARAVATGSPDPLAVVQSAVLEYGFIGVKVYPPMGWRPLGNKAGIDMTMDEARQLDIQLRQFYQWCCERDVPVTAHANRSNYPHEEFADFAGVGGWTDVLAEFPQLRLNLGHFGGAKIDPAPHGWPQQMAALAIGHDHVFVDVGNHRIADRRIASAQLQLLTTLFDAADTARMANRVMYGSDWFMLAILEGHDTFLADYRSLIERYDGGSVTERFLGGNALHFLGFRTVDGQPDMDNQNAGRLRARYETYAPDRMPTWLTS